MFLFLKTCEIPNLFPGPTVIGSCGKWIPASQIPQLVFALGIINLHISAYRGQLLRHTL